MDTYASLEDLPLQRIWVGVVAGVVQGDRMSFAVVELAPNSIVAWHQHPNERIGLVLRGTLTLAIGAGAGSCTRANTYNIPADVPHDVVTARDGAVVIDVFAPVRADGARFIKETTRPH